MKFLRTAFAAAIIAAAVCFLPTKSPAAELTISANDDSLTTGVLTVANSAYGEFYAPEGSIVIRALDDATTTTTRAFIKYFPGNPESTDLDASTRAKTGVAIQEGDTITITLPEPGWIAIDGLTGTSQIVAHVKR